MTDLFAPSEAQRVTANAASVTTAERANLRSTPARDLDRDSGFANGREWARSVSWNTHRSFIRRVFAFEAPADFEQEPALPDALGNGLVILHLLFGVDSDEHRFRDEIEHYAEWTTGDPYPCMARIAGFVEGAQEALAERYPSLA